MKGIVLDFNLENRMGLIRNEQGERYHFLIEDWNNSELPKAGDQIDFIAIGEQAHEIYRINENNNPYQSPKQWGASGQPSQTNSLAIVSMIAGIAGLIVFGSLIAVICGHIARSQIRNSGGTQEGDGMALAGLITGYIGLALTIAVMIIWLIVIIAAASSGSF